MTDSVKPKKVTSAALWRAMEFTWPYRGWMIVSIACALLMGIVQTVSLTTIFPILNILIEGKTVQSWVAEAIAKHGNDVPFYLRIAESAAQYVPERPLYAVGVLFAFVSFTVVIGNIFRFFHEHLSDRIAIYAVHDLRRKLYDHLLHMPLNYFGRHGTSDVTSRLVADASQLQDGIRVILGQMIQSPITVTLSLSFALWVNWKLTLIVILFLPPAFAVMKKLGSKVRRATRAALERGASMLGQVESTLQGVRVVKSARAERFERRRYGEIMNEIRRQQIKLSKYEAVTTPAMEVTALFAMGAILMLASWMMFEKHWLDKTSFIAIMFALGTIAEPLRRLSKLNNVIQRASAAAARMFQIVDVPAERGRGKVEGEARSGELVESPAEPSADTRNLVASSAPRVVLPPLQSEIVFDDVSFSYPNTDSLALDRVTLRVPKGQSIAVVGRNGSGKTTLLALLPRFYDPNGGAVLIDGVDLRQATLRSLRKQIALVTQDSVIFSGTIAQNIAYGHPLARNLDPDIPLGVQTSVCMKELRNEIESAAKRAFAHDFIVAKPKGYDTVLDGLGSQLSGGQKQRLCIARAILRKAPILILDEATSQVDAESEHLIQQAIESVMHEATTFVIAHRFSTILSADVIVVMDNGRIVGQGKHDELLKTCEVYQQLYERQMIGAPT